MIVFLNSNIMYEFKILQITIVEDLLVAVRKKEDHSKWQTKWITGGTDFSNTTPEEEIDLYKTIVACKFRIPKKLLQPSDKIYHFL